MENIIILVFSSDLYNLAELKSMPAAERIEMAKFERAFGYDNADAITPAQFQDLFNAGKIDPDSNYIFFEKEK